MLGKRKRDTQVAPARRIPKDHEEDTTHIPLNTSTNDIFRQYFEAQFAPLPVQQVVGDTEGSEEDHESEGSGSEDENEDAAVSDGSEWSGISEVEERVMVVEVVDRAVRVDDEDDEFHRARQKAFMSARPPREIEIDSTSKPSKASDKEDLGERVNLKHDLDLQRLLKESHLLERSRVSSTPGKERQKALDMRLQTLGAKESLFSQQKMPVGHRVGISKKAESREAKRRHEAKENGVILEKVSMSSGGGKKGAKNKSTRRERGVDAPGVGRFSGGTLKLSRKDVASIQGPPTAARKGKRR